MKITIQHHVDDPYLEVGFTDLKTNEEAEKLKQKILQDREDAKKLHRLLSIHKETNLFNFNKNIHDWKQIVKRVEELIKEKQKEKSLINFENDYDRNTIQGEIDELQEILEEKKK